MTVTALSRVTCPRLLTSRAALFVIGGVPRAAVLGVREGLAKIIDALTAAGGGRVARVLLGDDQPAPTWAVTPEERAVAAHRLRAIYERPVGTAAQWSAALTAADQLFAALPPTERPLLIVVDGRRPANPLDVVLRRLDASIEACSDMAGHSLLVDVSEAGWLASLGSIARGHAVVIAGPDGTYDDLPAALGQVMTAFQVRLSAWHGELRTVERTFKVLTAVPETEHDDHFIEWNFSAQGFDATFEVKATFRAVASSRTGTILFVARPVRQLAGSEFGTRDVVAVCIQPVLPARIQCPGSPPQASPTGVGNRHTPTSTAPPSPTPTPSGTPHTTPSPTPTSPSTASPSATVTESPTPSWRLFVPITERR